MINAALSWLGFPELRRRVAPCDECGGRLCLVHLARSEPTE